jgi:hypothetical protein
MTLMRALILGAAVAGCLIHPVYAEDAPKDPNDLKEVEAQRRKDDEAIDKQYKATLKRTHRDAVETRTDPWTNMRGPDDSKTKR